MTTEPFRIQLNHGRVALVDAQDADLAEVKWFAKSYMPIWYAMRNERVDQHTRRSVRLHRVVAKRMGIAGIVDHINGDGLDNRRANLRPTSTRTNSFNARRRSDNTSGYKGVTLRRRTGRWEAKIKHSGGATHLGSFGDPKEAAMAYDAAARELFGEFARLNFPEARP